MLKPGGYFILFDAYRTELNNISSKDSKIMKQVENGMALERFEEYININKYAKNSGLKNIESRNMSNKIKADVIRFKIYAFIAFKIKPFYFILTKLLPKEFIGNIISGYYMGYSLKNKLFIYCMDIFQK